MAIHAAKFLKTVNHMIEKMNRKDIAVLKIDIIFGTLLIVHFWPELSQAHRGWYVVIILCCEIYLFQRLLIWKLLQKKKSDKKKSDKKSD
jgi:K+ transporter